MAMRKAVKKLWVKALRSGKYKRTTGALKKNGGFCCLGVLCDVHQKEMKKNKKKVTPWVGLKTLPYKGYGTEHDTGVLTKEVMKWAGLKDCNPVVDGSSLSAWNDDTRKGFKGIANLIEKHL